MPTAPVANLSDEVFLYGSMPVAPIVAILFDCNLSNSLSKSLNSFQVEAAITIATAQEIIQPPVTNVAAVIPNLAAIPLINPLPATAPAVVKSVPILVAVAAAVNPNPVKSSFKPRSEEHTSELQSQSNLV